MSFQQNYIKCPRCGTNALQEIEYDKVETTCYTCGYQSYESVILETYKETFNYGVLCVVIDSERGAGQTFICKTKENSEFLIKEAKKQSFEYIYITLFEDGKVKKINID